MSLHQPVFRQIELYSPGLHRGLFFRMRQRSNRYKQQESARTRLGVDAVIAGRLAFAAWLTEMRILTDDPGDEHLPVAQARLHGLEAWWTLDEGEVEVRTSHESLAGIALPRSSPTRVPWAPHLILGVAKGAPADVIEDAYHRQAWLFAPDDWLTDKQRARAERRVDTLREAFTTSKGG